MRQHGLGISKIKIGEIDVPVYDLERSLVEGFKAASPDVAIKALKEAFEPDRKPSPSPAKHLHGRSLGRGARSVNKPAMVSLVPAEVIRTQCSREVHAE